MTPITEKTFENHHDKYEKVLDIVADGSRRVIMLELLAMKTVDVKQSNHLNHLCADNAVEVFENCDSSCMSIDS